jgi:hypothetical protein
MLDALMRNLRAAGHSEATIAHAKARQLAARLIFAICAATAAVFGIVALNLGLWLALRSSFGAAWASAVVSLADFFLSGAFFLLVARHAPSQELEEARQLRRRAINELQTETHALEKEFSALRTDLRARGLTLLKPPFDVALARIVVPAAIYLVRRLRRKKHVAEQASVKAET